MKNGDRTSLPIVVTDLDGTLLDHETYDYSPALPALKWIKEHDIPLILASSKTASEISALQKELNIVHPAIVENGGGVWMPEGYFPTDDNSPVPGITYENIKHILSKCPRELRQKFEGFCDWTVAAVSKNTGLKEEDAARAKDRAWSIPGLWSGSDEEFFEFKKYLRSHNLKVTQGGRFIHIMGDTSKGVMLSWLVQCFKRKYPNTSIVSYALGDAPNDKSMLEAADHAIVIPNLSGKVLTLDPTQMKGVLHNADEPGPAGWNKAVLPLLKEFELNQNSYER